MAHDTSTGTDAAYLQPTVLYSRTTCRFRSAKGRLVPRDVRWWGWGGGPWTNGDGYSFHLCNGRGIGRRQRATDEQRNRETHGDDGETTDDGRRVVDERPGNKRDRCVDCAQWSRCRQPGADVFMPRLSALSTATTTAHRCGIDKIGTTTIWNRDRNGILLRNWKRLGHTWKIVMRACLVYACDCMSTGNKQ